MSNFQTEINHTLQEFVLRITDLARRVAIDTLESAFGERQSAEVRVPMLVISNPVAASIIGRPPGSRSPKRTAEDLDALAERFASFVKSNPGLRIEQINKQLKATTKDLALPIRKLIADGAISTKGQKRSTLYFAGKKSVKN